MDFELSEQQRILRSVAREFLQENCPSTHVRAMEEDRRGFSDDIWQRMASLGWLSLPFPEGYDGAEGSFLDLAVLLEEMGRVAFPSPYVSTVALAGLTILDVGSEEHKQELLPAIGRGNCFATLAVAEASGTYRPQDVAAEAVRRDGGFEISGAKLFVPDAHVANVIVCAAHVQGDDAGGVSLFLVRAPIAGLTVDPLPTIANDRQCRVTLDRVFVPSGDVLGPLGGAGAAVQRAVARGALATCAVSVGACQSAFELAAKYVKERMAFGQPIGKFQAVQHHVANVYIDVEAARFLTYEACWRYANGLPCDQHISVAKVWLGTAGQKLTRTTMQLHGGISLTKEYDVQLFFRRVKGAEPLYGGASRHLRAVADSLGV